MKQKHSSRKATTIRIARIQREQEIHTFKEVRLHGCAKEIQYVIHDSCWLCVSHHFKSREPNKGYVCLHRNGKSVNMHRHVWQKENERYLKPGEIVLWTCGNPRCINPAHLVLDAKCRYVGIHRRKLTMEQADAIRWEHAKGTKQLALAVEYNVCQATIANIIANKTYRRTENVPVDDAA